MAGGKGKRDREQELADMTEAYSAEYLADVASGEARQERLAELKRRIALGAYKPDPDAIAEGMLSRVNLGAESDSEDDSEPDCGCDEE
jgi:anti-sigma28 factor (negative regulator of flagellin synthesis)